MKSRSALCGTKHQVRERRETEAMERQSSQEVCRELERSEGLQWGRPGPGGAYWRSSAITGQGFFDKMVGGQHAWTSFGIQICSIIVKPSQT